MASCVLLTCFFSFLFCLSRNYTIKFEHIWKPFFVLVCIYYFDLAVSYILNHYLTEPIVLVGVYLICFSVHFCWSSQGPGYIT